MVNQLYFTKIEKKNSLLATPIFDIPLSFRSIIQRVTNITKFVFFSDCIYIIYYIFARKMHYSEEILEII